MIDELFKARIAAQRIEEWIDFDKKTIGLFVSITSLEPINCLIFVSEPEMSDRKSKSPDGAISFQLLKLFKRLQSFFAIALGCIEMRQVTKAKLPADLGSFFVLGNRFFKLTS